MKAACEHFGRAPDKRCSDCPLRARGTVATGSTAQAQIAALNARADEIRRRAPLSATQAAPVVSGTLSPAPAYVRPAGADVAVREAGSVTWWQPEDEPEAIDGAKLLYHVGQYFGTYVAFPSVAAHVTVILWNAHAAARDRNDEGIGELIWRATPRLGMTSPDNKSGKSTVLDLSRFLHHVQRPVKITGRALAHKIGRRHQTLTLDEVKTLFGAGAASKDVQGVLLAGYTPGATWEYSSGNKTVEIPCFGPVAYAAKDELITATGEQLVDLFDRTIFVRMRRATVLMPQVDEEAEDEGRQWGDDLALWTTQVKAQLKARAKELAKIDHETSLEAAHGGREIDGRTPQIWRPLLAVADVAGGPWPELARRAMRELTEVAPSAETAQRMAGMDERAARYAPLSFIDGPQSAVADDDDYDDDEEF